MNTFTVDQKTLFSILSWMQPICTKRTTLDVTSSILFHINAREITIKSTDLEISLQATVPLLESDFFESKEFLVSGKRLYDVIKELENTIRGSFTDNQLHIKSNWVDVALHTKDIEGFPAFPERIENIMQLEAGFLLTVLDKVAFLIPQNNANPSLNGLLLEISTDGLTMTTTDGHSLAQVQSSNYCFTESKKWLLPRRAILELKKILENIEEPIFLGICNNQLVFSGQFFNFFSKLLVNKFPEYTTILQKDGFTPATVDRHQFIKTLRRSTSLLSGNFIATQFGFTDTMLHVAMNNKEVGNLKETIEVQGFKGARLDIRFYAPYLLTGLQAFSDESLNFYIKSSTKPIVFQAEQDSCTVTYLVMPVSPAHVA